MSPKTICCISLVLLTLTAATADTSPGSVQVRRDLRDIAVTQDGTVYVLDGVRREVIKLDPAGKLLWACSIPAQRGNPFLSALVLRGRLRGTCWWCPALSLFAT
ncbi:MAG: hypothetical protein Q7T82_02500 [Armatimonadota bacterium]|nr:hypothetical protein [Armatimonadota bacterium]